MDELRSLLFGVGGGVIGAFFKFWIEDLSATGMKITIEPKSLVRTSHLSKCTLVLGKQKVTTPEFSAKLTVKGTNHRGYRFVGLDELAKTQIKQFLMDGLKIHFDEKIREHKK